MTSLLRGGDPGAERFLGFHQSVWVITSKSEIIDDVTSLLDSAPDPTVSGRRAEVLAELREAQQTLTADDIAQRTGLHVNTARFHLDRLVRDGLVERSTEQRVAPGRPHTLYTARDIRPGPRSYGLLAEVLTGLVASLPDARTSAEAVGREWGGHLVDRAAPSQHLSAADSVARLNAVLDAVGFHPEVRSTKGRKGCAIWLHHCPFREVAEQHTDVVCAIHLGLMQGALEELRAPVEVVSLDPFVSPDTCVARLRTVAARTT